MIKTFWKQLHWSLRTLSILILLTLAYAGIGFLGVPALGEYLLANQVAEILGKPVSVERIEYNPFTWKLNIHGLAVSGKDPKTPDLTARRIGADVQFSGLHKGILAVEGITLQKVRFRPAGFDLPTAPLDLNLDGLNATVSMYLERAEESGTWSPALTGRLALNGVAVNAPGQGKVLGLATLAAGLEKFSTATNTLSMDRVSLKAPYVKAVRKEDGTINLTSLAGPAQKQKTEQVQPGSPLRFSVAGISVTGGRVEFSDLAVPGGITKEISSLNLGLEHLSNTPGSTAPLQAGLQTGAGETLSIKGSLGLAPLKVQGTLQAANISLPAYAPYYGQAVPFAIGSGTLQAGSEFLFNAEGEDLLKLSRLQAGLAELSLTQRDADAPFFTLSSVDLAGGELNLGQQNISVTSVSLNQGTLHMTRTSDGSLDLVNMFSRPGGSTPPSPASTPETDSKAPIWGVTTAAVNLTDFALHLKDDAAPRPGTLSVSDLDLTLKNIDSSLTVPMSVDLGASLQKGGRIQMVGDVTPGNLTGSGTFDMDGVDVRTASMYIPETMRISLREGTLDGRGTWDLGPENEVALKAQADVALTGFSAGENGRPDRLLGLGKLALDNVQYDMSAPKLSIASVSVDEPFADLAVDESGTLNLARIFGGDSAQETKRPESPNENATPMAVSIGKTTLDKGMVKFRDETFAPAMATSLHDITGSVSTLTLGSPEPSKVSLKAGINGHAPLVIEGHVAPFAEQLHTDLLMSLTNLDMVTLSPYLRKYLAYPVSTGQLSWESTFLTKENRLKGSNRFRFKRFVLGDKVKSPDAPDVPVKLALSLLQDGEGNMDLDVPVQGNLDDPGFRIGGVIIQAIIGVFRNIVTAPFSIIGSVFGSGEDVSTVPFEPGRADLGEIAKQKLTTVATALKERPGMRIDLTGLVNPEADRIAVTERRMENRVKGVKFAELEKAGKAPAHIRDVEFADKEEYLTFLAQTYLALHPTTDPKTLQAMFEQDLENGLRKAMTVPDHDLKALADQRTAMVQSFLIKEQGVSAEQVFRKDKDQDLSKAGEAQVRLGLHG